MSREGSSRVGVLLVDEYPVVRCGVKHILASQPGLSVLAEAGDRASAVRAAMSPQIGLVVTGIALGQDSGLDLIRELHAARPALPLLVLSRYEESVFAERALHLGARGYVTKNRPPEVIVEAIRHVLRGRIYVSSAVESSVLRGLRPDAGPHRGAPSPGATSRREGHRPQTGRSGGRAAVCGAGWGRGGGGWGEAAARRGRERKVVDRGGR